MNDQDHPRRESTERSAALRIFGFDAPDDPWMERVREAESPLPYGCIGPYELEEEISRGGQGIVFRARQPGTRRRVAVKRLLGGSFATPGMRRRFEREVEALTTLNHPHIVTIFAMDVVDGVPVLAMQWIDGAPITRWAEDAAEGRRPPHQIVRMMLTVCDAVQHAHQRGVIHRDLKPSNILIDTSGTPHIVDFGLAKFSRSSTEPPTSATDQFVGTLAYASPEQRRGLDEEVDVRSDVYSLGVILCELLTAERPCDRGESLTVGPAVEFADGLQLGMITKHLNPDLRAIVLKALAQNASVRYQSADALAGDLRNFLAGEPVSARSPGGWDQLRKTLRRHRVAVGFALALLTVVSLFAGVTTILAIRLAEQRDLAVRAQQREAAAREQAEQESAKARTINRFLQDMLAAADPRRTGNAHLTVRDVLDHAAGRLDSQLGQQSEVKAGIEVVLGRTYQNLGLLDAAESHLRSALALYRSLSGDERETILNLLTDLATVLHSKGDHQAAGTITEEAVVLYRELLAQGHPLLQADIVGLAGYFFVKGDHDGAKELYEEALSAHRRLLGNAHPAVAHDLAGLACLLGQLGESEDATRLAHEGLAIIRGMPHLETPELAVSLFEFGRALHQVRAFDEARDIYEQAIAVQRRVYGDEHAVLAETLSHYANLLANMRELSAAEAAYRRALNMQQALYGPDHRGVAFCQARLGGVLLDQDRFQEAETELRAALGKLERSLPQGHRDIAHRQHDLGRCLTALGRHAEAEPYLLNSHVIIAGRHGEDDQRAQGIRKSIIDLYQAWSRCDQLAQWQAGLRPESATQRAGPG